MSKILYIDDEVNTEKMDSYFHFFEKEGLNIIKVRDIENSIEEIEKYHFQIDLLILDNIMPFREHYKPSETNGGSTTGIRLLKDIRKKYPQIPVVIVSRNAKTKDMETDLKELNVIKYITKSLFNSKEIVIEIKKLLKDLK